VKVCKKPFRELNSLASSPSWPLEAFEAGILYSRKYSQPVMPFGLIPVTEIYNFEILVLSIYRKYLVFEF
jgi:hypothetical protein